MNRDKDENLLKEMGHKLSQLRQNLKETRSQMADRLGIWRSTYIRNENGETPISYKTMISLVNRFGVSLDWMVLNKGPMYFKEKEVKNEQPPNPLDSLNPDFKELIEHMERIPMLKHEMLLSFCKFKEDRKDLVETAMKKA
ncbi:MAG: helix-turn-helix transcriptional regulator [Candidatus Aminicenantes bacterium]|nr:helix-turn-helix transcriptional regulator [Candidatus Aminicenantes bacterium]